MLCEGYYITLSMSSLLITILSMLYLYYQYIFLAILCLITTILCIFYYFYMFIIAGKDYAKVFSLRNLYVSFKKLFLQPPALPEDNLFLLISYVEGIIAILLYSSYWSLYILPPINIQPTLIINNKNIAAVMIKIALIFLALQLLFDIHNFVMKLTSRKKH